MTLEFETKVNMSLQETQLEIDLFITIVNEAALVFSPAWSIMFFSSE